MGFVEKFPTDPTFLRFHCCVQRTQDIFVVVFVVDVVIIVFVGSELGERCVLSPQRSDQTSGCSGSPAEDPASSRVWEAVPSQSRL